MKLTETERYSNSKNQKASIHSEQQSRASQKKKTQSKVKPDGSKDHVNGVFSKRPQSAMSNFTAISGLNQVESKDLNITQDDLIFKKYV